MTIEYIRYKISEEQQERFILAIQESCAILAAYPDCLAYELSRCEEDKTLFTWRIEWTSIEKHLHGFRKSGQFAEFFKLVKPYVSNIQEMNHYIGIIDSKK
jgi:quinol monooxygenase YgiN